MKGNMGSKGMETDIATFAAGCFWGVQKAFDALEGVLSTQVGYTGGTVPNPSYEMVCSHQTGHAESIQIEFNPQIISYKSLLDTFWEIHHPTSINRDLWDPNDQYRSAIFYHSEAQKQIAEQSKKERETQVGSPIVTQIVPVTVFYRAEQYHQHYLKEKENPR
jgi:peptide-methionine (S)-S-oxide reductase